MTCWAAVLQNESQWLLFWEGQGFPLKQGHALEQECHERVPALLGENIGPLSGAQVGASRCDEDLVWGGASKGEARDS